MNDELFEIYQHLLKICNTKKEVKILNMGIDLGISEGIYQCKEKLDKVVSKVE